jgi:hypothetical protein
MIRTPRKDNLPPEGGNCQNGDTDKEAKGLQSNQSAPLVTSTPAIKPPSVTAMTTETVEETDEITSTTPTTQGRPLPPTPVTGMEGIERPVETKVNVMQSAEAEKTAEAATKLIVQSSTLSEAVAGKQKLEIIQEKSVLSRQSLGDEDASIIAKDASMIAPRTTASFSCTRPSGSNQPRSQDRNPGQTTTNSRVRSHEDTGCK